MGVKNLWEILEPCKKTLPLHHLQNKRVCIDLSCWIVQLQSVNRSHCSTKEKVYLRGLFHRLRALISLNCSVILVTDGAIPAVKLSTYRRRLNALNEVTKDDVERQKTVSLQRNMGSEFSCMIKEAKTLAKALGIPCLDGIEEAEAQCALLNSENLCEGCFTTDSDVFLFGARTVYRDICLDKGGSVICYEMSDIEIQLGLGRNSLVALSLLLGSDYSHGVRGIGPDSACHIVKSISEDVVLQRVASDGISFLTSLKTTKKNRKLPQLHGKENFADPQVKKATGDQPLSGKDNEALPVIEAYMKPKCHSADSDPVYRVLAVQPFQRAAFQEICSKFFEWPPEKTDEYILPKIAERELRKFANLRSSSSQLGVALPLHMMPMQCPISEVLTPRRVQGRECFEVSWEIFDGLKTSVVPADLVQSACPEKIAEFEERKAQMKKQNRRKPRPKKTDDTVSMANVDTQLQSLLLDIERDDNTRFNPISELTSCKPKAQKDMAPIFSVDLRPESPSLDTEPMDNARLKTTSCSSSSASGSSVDFDLTVSDIFLDDEYENNINIKQNIDCQRASVAKFDSRPEKQLGSFTSERLKLTSCSSSSASGSSVEIDLTGSKTFIDDEYENITIKQTMIDCQITSVAKFDSRPEKQLGSFTSGRIAIDLEVLDTVLNNDYERHSSHKPPIDSRSAFSTSMETDVIDLSSPSPLQQSRQVSRCQGGNIELVNVIDLSDSDMEISPEHVQKAKELRVFLANIREEIS